MAVDRRDRSAFLFRYTREQDDSALAPSCPRFGSSRGGAANFLLGGPSSNLKEAFFVWNSYIYHRGVASFFSEGEGQKIISQFIFG